MRTEYEVELKDFQKEYLDGIKDKHDIPDIGKVIRCLIDFSVDRDDLETEIFAFERCHSCD